MYSRKNYSQLTNRHSWCYLELVFLVTLVVSKILQQWTTLTMTALRSVNLEIGFIVLVSVSMSAMRGASIGTRPRRRLVRVGVLGRVLSSLVVTSAMRWF
jgi:hypothetical protein